MEAVLAQRAKLFAIAHDNERIYLYPNVAQLRRSPRPGAAGDSLDFFDVGGFRLEPVLAGDRTLTDLRSAGESRSAAVHQRLVLVVDQLRIQLEKLTPDQSAGIARLPQLPDLAGLELAECYQRLAGAGLECSTPELGWSSSSRGDFWGGIWHPHGHH